jgi:hypothetical protein
LFPLVHIGRACKTGGGFSEKLMIVRYHSTTLMKFQILPNSFRFAEMWAKNVLLPTQRDAGNLTNMRRPPLGEPQGCDFHRSPPEGCSDIKISSQLPYPYPILPQGGPLAWQSSILWLKSVGFLILFL